MIELSCKTINKFQNNKSPVQKGWGFVLPGTCFFPTRYKNTFPDFLLRAGPDRALTV